MATQTKNQVLEHEFLIVRAKILEIAAAFDRLDRAEDRLSDSSRRDLLEQGVQLLQSPADNRAEQVQQLFSREYQDGWREQFEI